MKVKHRFLKQSIAKPQLQVVNILGEVVLDKTMAENRFNLNVAHLVAGTYFVILKDAEHISIEKFLKQ